MGIARDMEFYQTKLSDAMDSFTKSFDKKALRVFCELDSELPLMYYARTLALYMIGEEDPYVEGAIGIRYVMGREFPKDQEKGIAMMKNAIERGDSFTHYNLAAAYFEMQDYHRALEQYEWCSKHPEAFLDIDMQYILIGLAWLYETICDGKEREAFELYHTAAERYHDAYGCSRIAEFYSETKTLQEEPYKIYTYLQNAITYGLAEPKKGWNKLGAELASGRLAFASIFGDDKLGIQVDIEEARRILQPFEDSDMPETLNCLSLAWFYEDDRTKSNFYKAIQFAEKLAKHPEYSGNGSAENLMGISYYFTNQMQNAEKNLRYAFEHGIYDYTEVLGKIYVDMKRPYEAIGAFRVAMKEDNLSTDSIRQYMNILIGLEPECSAIDHRTAIEVAEYGADRYQDIYSIFVLSKLVVQGYYSNIMSVQQAVATLEEMASEGRFKQEIVMLLGDYYSQTRYLDKAVKYYEKAISFGEIDAMVKIGRIYEKGGGNIVSNPKTAYYWYKKAEENGSAEGRKEASCFKVGLLGNVRRVQF